MIYKNITELIGGTPLVEISGVEGQKARIAVKLEKSNPGGGTQAMIIFVATSGSPSMSGAMLSQTSGNTGASSVSSGPSPCTLWQNHW